MQIAIFFENLQKIMNPTLIIIVLLSYFGILMLLAFLTSKGANNLTFFIANKKSKWYWVALGMVGTSLSGITFLSVPGWVKSSQFSYMQMVLGYILGYFFVAYVLLPVYYKLKVPSIYGYLKNRFGDYSYKTGASFFIISRLMGASLRVFIVVNLLQFFVFDKWGIPFFLTAAFFLLLMLLYTYKGGVKTLIYTDLLQTIGMVFAVVFTIIFVSKELKITFNDIISTIVGSKMSKMFFFDDYNSQYYFFKQFLAGAFITITMTGLDQEMMQKNISCKNLRDAQKNMITYSIIIAIVNLLFLSLGVLLYLYAESNNIILPEKSDHLFPYIAINYIGGILAIVFLIGLISATFPSADGALTSLTTIFCVDILGLLKKNLSEERVKKIRFRVHISFTILLYIVIVIFSTITKSAIIEELFTIAGYTYGPLLGLYIYGLFTKLNTKEKFVPIITITSPIICYFLNKYSEYFFGGYKFGFELILINGLFTFVLLYVTSLIKSK